MIGSLVERVYIYWLRVGGLWAVLFRQIVALSRAMFVIAVAIVRLLYSLGLRPSDIQLLQPLHRVLRTVASSLRLFRCLPVLFADGVFGEIALL